MSTQTIGIASVPPGPPPRTGIGSLIRLRRGSLIEYYTNAWRQYGDFVRFQYGPFIASLIVHPDNVHRVLVANQENYRKGDALRRVRLVLGQGLFTSDGELWRRQRRIMQPPFTPRDVTQFGGHMVAAIEAMLQRWQRAADQNQPLDVNAEMMRLAMGIIARVLFSVGLDEEASEAGDAVTRVLEFVSHRSVSVFDLPLSVPTRTNRRFLSARRTLDRYLYGMMDARQSEPAAHNDLLAMLMQARDPETGEPMSRQQLHDELVTLFFAGHETTAQAMTWAWYLLAMHPEVEARLHDELREVLRGRAAQPEDMPSLQYTRRIIDETLRLYSPVWVFVRQAIGDDEIGGYHVPAGSIVSLSPYLTHRHPGFWEEPDRFDPDRFTPGRSESRHRYAYFPFGGGPRVCLGNSFALLEATLALATVAQRYRLRLVPGQDIQPAMVSTLRPSRPVLVTLESQVDKDGAFC